MADDSSHSRREVLGLAGAVAASAFAGCSGILPGSSSNPTVIKNISFQGDEFVVHLKNDTDADAIDLRSPSGDLLRTASVGRKSKVAFPLLNKSRKPYSPGNYTLVAVETNGNGDSHRINEHSLKLTSSFASLLVRPVFEHAQSDYYTTTPPSVATKVRVTIKNKGTLPVGIKYIGIPEGVPSPTKSPTEPRSQSFRPINGPTVPPFYVPGGGAVNFQSVGAPLSYYQQLVLSPNPDAVGVPKQGASWQEIKANHCNGEQHTATLVIIPIQGPKRKRKVTFKYGGKAVRHDIGATDYTCTNVTVVNTESENTTTTTAR